MHYQMNMMISSISCKWLSVVARSKVDFILAVPTASWSADSNTLCLVRADGSRFEKVDQMLLNTQWFKWRQPTIY